MIHEGNVTLPDGRMVHGRITASHERDTNATNILLVDLEWLDASPLTADEYNEQIEGGYLHEVVTDNLLLVEPYYCDDTF